MRASAASLILTGVLVISPSMAGAQPQTPRHFEVDVTGLVAAAGAYVAPVTDVADSRYSLGGRVGFSWDWASWGGTTFAHPVFNAIYADIIGRAQFNDPVQRTFVSLEAGPTLMRYDWGDDGSGSGLFAGVHAGGGIGWGKFSAGVNARIGHTFNRLGNAPLLPRGSWGVLITPYLRIAF